MTVSPDPTNRRIVLASRPHGEPSLECFGHDESPVPEPGDGEVLLRTIYLSLDPYMRGRMSSARSYAAPVDVGAVMVGGTVSEVVESRSPDLSVGDLVLSYSGWQTYATAPGRSVRRLDPDVAPISAVLGVLGMPGFTAYAGLLQIGRPAPGETVVVAAATGPVGSAVGQIARIKGARVVGIAGGSPKCAYVRDELGFDVALDHRSPRFVDELADATPTGIDVYFENVGGAVWDAVLPRLNEFARVPVCGLVANYNLTRAPDGPNRAPALMSAILTKSLTVRGFIQREFVAEHHDDFRRDVAGWIESGELRDREEIVSGLDQAPAAFIGMLRGDHVGKLLVQVGDDPTRPDG